MAKIKVSKVKHGTLYAGYWQARWPKQRWSKMYDLDLDRLMNRLGHYLKARGK